MAIQKLKALVPATENAPDSSTTEPVPVTIYRCCECGAVKKLHTWLVLPELLCSKCKRRIKPKFIDSSG